MEDQAEAIERIVRADAEREARIDAEARATAHALIQGYIEPNHRVRDIKALYDALVQALKAAAHAG